MFKALIKWVYHSKSERYEFLDELLKLIRFQLMEPSYVIQEVYEENLIKNNLKLYSSMREHGGNLEIGSSKNRLASAKRAFIRNQKGVIHVCKTYQYFMEKECKFEIKFFEKFALNFLNLANNIKVIEKYIHEEGVWSFVRADRTDVVARLIINQEIYDIIRFDLETYGLLLFNAELKCWNQLLIRADISIGLVYFKVEVIF